MQPSTLFDWSRLFVEHAPAAIAMLDRNMRYLVVSRRWTADYRLGETEVVGRSHYEIFPDLPERWKEIHRRCLAGAIENSEQEAFPRADGSTDWVRWEVRPWRTAAGAIGGVIIFSEVITQRVRAAEAVREREQRMQLALDAAGAGTWVLDLASGRTDFDDRLREMFALPPGVSSIRNEDILAALHPDDRARTEAVLREAIVNHRDYDIEQRIVRPDGSLRRTVVKGRAEYDRQGRAVRVRGVTTDITARKVVEAAAQRELATRAELSAVFERVTDAFVALDRDWRYVYMNRRAGELFGRDPGKMVGRHIWTEFPEGADQPFAQAYRRAMATQQPITLEDYYAPWDRWFENRIYPSPDGLSIYFHEITERKCAEAAARESALRLQTIVRSADVGLWDWDLATDRVYFSPEWKRQIGYEDHELGNDFAEWRSRLHPEDIERTLALVRRYIAAPWSQYQVEFRLRHRDGSWRWILATGALLNDAHGKPARMLGSHLDVTGLKQAELAARESRQRLLDLIDGLGPHIFVGLLAVDGTLLEANRSALAAAQVKREDVLGKPVHETVWVTHSPRVQKEFRDAVTAAAGGGTVRFDTQLRVAGGAMAWVDFTLQPLRDSAGTIRYLVASSAVITERKEAEDELRHTAAQLDSAQERAHLGSWELDLATGQSSWSREMFRLYRCDPERGVPRVAEFIEMIDPQDRALLENLPKQVVAGGGSVSVEYRTNPGLGPVRHLNLVAYGTPDAAGKVHRLAGTVLDITARKQAARELERSAQRLRELARQLVQAQETERRSLSAELHDVLGPNLTGLSINLKVIASRLGSAPGDAVSKPLHDSQDLLEKSVAFTRDLIAELRPPALDDYGLLAGLRWYGAQLQARTGMIVAVEGSEPMPRLARPVETALFRIAQEALNNTTKHARAQRATLQLARRDGRVTLAIGDDGAGFEPAGAAASAAGAHWGLAMMQERAEAAGGRFTVESAPGQGTRIVIDVPGAA